MRQKIKTLEDVVKSNLCNGCGACAFVADKGIRMVDDEIVGRRPFLDNDSGDKSQLAKLLQFCPGWSVNRSDIIEESSECIPSLQKQWGNVLEVWEVYADNQEIRKSGSSGGCITAISLYCLEVGGMSGVLNTHQSALDPVKNESSISRTREQLLNATGSRYSPSSPCEKLNEIEGLDGAGVFIGKPCDAVAVHKIRKDREKLNQKLGVVISFFCAGTPSTFGVNQLIDKVVGGDSCKVDNIRFRGNGWPGMWVLGYWVGERINKKVLTYQESWGFLQKYRQWRCYICPDHTGEFSDISVGDPWYRGNGGDDLGKSLVVVRTELGRKILHEAADAGYIVLGKSDPSMLPKSQPNLITAKAVLWGRIFALKLVGIGVPDYRGFELLSFWIKDLTIKQKVNSILGTIRRVFVKKINIEYSIKDIN